MKLSNEGFICAFVDELKVYTDILNYDSRIPSLSKRFSIFWNNITHMQNFSGQEYVASLINPNWLVITVVYIILLRHSAVFPFWVSYSTILITAITFLLAFCISIMNVNIFAKEYVYLFAYPIYSIGHMIVNFPPIRGIIRFISNRGAKHSIEKMETSVIVTDGQHDYQCKLELISDNGLAKVRFINKNKVYTTKNNHLRMVDAIRELTAKLNDYGLSLKICQSCKYFQPIVDGSTNMVKGTCYCNFEGRTPGDIIPTLIWNTCPGFEENNIVNLF